MKKTYILRTEEKLHVSEETNPGMAGEPMICVFLILEDDCGQRPMRYEDISRFMNSADRLELSQYLDSVNENNLQEAIRFTI